MCIPTTTHPFDSIPSSKESQCHALSPDLLFVTIQPVIIEIWLFTWSYCISTFLLIDLNRHSLHLFDYGFFTEAKPSPTCWILFQAIWISDSQIIHHSSDSISLWSFSLFSQYSWWQYSLKATLSTFNWSLGSGQTLPSFLRNFLLSSSLSTLGEDHHFYTYLRCAYSNLLTQDSIGSYLPTLLTIAIITTPQWSWIEKYLCISIEFRFKPDPEPLEPSLWGSELWFTNLPDWTSKSRFGFSQSAQTWTELSLLESDLNSLRLFQALPSNIKWHQAFSIKKWVFLMYSARQ